MHNIFFGQFPDFQPISSTTGVFICAAADNPLMGKVPYSESVKEKEMKKKKTGLKEALENYSVSAREFISHTAKKPLAVGVGAVGALGLASQADAAVQYSGPRNIPINASVYTATVDLNGDGVNDFYFLFSSLFSSFIGAIGRPPGNHLLATFSYIFAYAKNLATNYLINDAADHWFFLGTLNGFYSTYGFGNFDGATGYIGVRFLINGNTHYGWIQYRGDLLSASGTIIDWAYEDYPDTPIRAGQRQSAGPPTTIPALNQWGIIVLILLLAGCGASAAWKPTNKD